MSGGEVRKVSQQDIQMVQNLIEQCLPYYMSLKEVAQTLLAREKIEPSFTELVWQKLEEQNQEFFRAYHTRMMVKEQITEFNRLLQRQVALMNQVTRGVSFAPMSNGSNIPPMHQSTACYAQQNSGPALDTEHMQQHVTSNLPGTFTNCGSSISPAMRNAVDMSVVPSGRIDVPPTILVPHSSNVGMVPGMIKTEGGGYGSSRFMYGGGGGASGGNVLETRATPIGDSVSSFSSSVESSSQPMNEALLDDTSSFGLFGGHFGLSDLTADFENSSGILESYSRSPFRENFLESRGGVEEHHGDNRRLDTISESLTYEDFGRV